MKNNKHNGIHIDHLNLNNTQNTVFLNPSEIYSFEESKYKYKLKALTNCKILKIAK